MAKPSCIRRPFQRWQLKTYAVRPVVLSLFFLVFVSGGTAIAAPKIQDLTKDASTQNGFAPQPGLSLKEATRIAKTYTGGGRVLSASPMLKPQGVEYRVRMLVDGERVVTITVDNRGRVRQRR